MELRMDRRSELRLLPRFSSFVAGVNVTFLVDGACISVFLVEGVATLVGLCARKAPVDFFFSPRSFFGDALVFVWFSLS